MSMKRIAFLTGTRADFGKLKSLMNISQKSEGYDVHIFATGMHMNPLYGLTIDEIYKSGFKNIYQFVNHEAIGHMDRTLARTIEGFSKYIQEIKPDLIIVHGDRVEALAGAIVGSLNNILVAHIEGGEISGTIDEHIRHSVSKMSHIHLVANNEAKNRLIQLGELQDSIFILGSPDLDLMNPKFLPTFEHVKKYYGIEFEKYAIAMFHPVTTEYSDIKAYIKNFVDALVESRLNYIVIYPNNDLGSIDVLNEYRRIEHSANFKLYPSLRFEYFLRLLKESEFIIGNSSAGIREAPFYSIPTVDIGTRQQNRGNFASVFHTDYTKGNILHAIEHAKKFIRNVTEDRHYFGEGKSDKLFLELLDSGKLWEIVYQKQFQELT